MQATGFVAQLRGLMDAEDVSLRELARRVPMDPGQLSRVLNGKRAPTDVLAGRCDEVFGTDGFLLAAARQERAQARRPVHVGRPTDELESLRCGVEVAVGAGATGSLGVDDWELAAMDRGRATRYRESGPLLAELAADCAELVRLLGLRQSGSAVRRLTRVTAQMSGLMSLTLIKLNRVAESDSWARTARLAADEAGDPAVRSWVRAQEAYTAFYGGDLPRAVEVARHAQALAGRTACVGVALAAALQARAHALMGQADEAHHALAVAESTLAALGGEDLSASAFGYSEAQFRFHEGNALTHLGDTTAAEYSHDRALELYPPDDFLDRALVRLDRAACLVRAGQVDAAATEAADTLTDLTQQQREGLVDLRAREILATMTATSQPPPAVSALHDLLTTTPGTGSST